MNRAVNFLTDYFIVILVGIVSMVFFFCVFINFDGLYGQDGYSYLNQLKIGVKNIGTGPKEFYPPFYAFAGKLISLLIQSNSFSLQLISILSWFGTTVLLYRILLKHLGIEKKLAVLIVFSCFFLSPFVLRMGILVMSDALALFMGLLAIYFGVYSKHKMNLFLFFIIAALAVLTRYANAVLVLPVLMHVLVRIYKEKTASNKMFALAGGAIGFLFLFFNFVFLSNGKGSINHNWLLLWDIKNFFARDFNHKDGILHYSLPNCLFVLKTVWSPIYTMILLPTFFFIRKKDFESFNSKLLFVSILLYSLFLAGIPFQNDRFLLPTFPILVILLSPALARLYNKGKLTRMLFLILLPIQLFISYTIIKPVFIAQKLEWQLVKSLKPYEGQTLYCFAIDIALEGRGLKFDYQNLWIEKYTKFDDNALVLFNTPKFEKQWDGKNPMINWNSINEKYTLLLIAEFDENWKLYRILKK